MLFFFCSSSGTIKGLQIAEVCEGGNSGSSTFYCDEIVVHVTV